MAERLTLQQHPASLAGVGVSVPLEMSSGGSVEFAELVERVEQGDCAALGQIYDLHHEAVRAFAQRLVGSAEEAEDLVHETFLSLPASMAGYRGMSSLRTWLISIAANHARHYVRAAARRRSAMERYREVVSEAVRSPERGASDRELARALCRALDALPLDQRVAFVLCEVEQRVSGEAAEIVGVPEATIRTRLFHAKRKLRVLLEREGYR